MKTTLNILTFLLVLLSVTAAGSAQTAANAVPRQPGWGQLSPEQQKILAPLADEWEYFPDLQRKRILATVDNYPRMSPAQKERYSERILRWARLSMQQRDAARARYRAFKSLPAEQRAEIKRRWVEQHQVEAAQPDKTNLTPAPDRAAEPPAVAE